MSNIQIHCRYTELKPTDSLVANPKNPNKHPDKQVDKIIRVIELNGWRAPIVVSARSGYITKGHGRLMAALKAGWTTVPVEVQEYESEAAEYSDVIADNKLASYAELDADMLDSILTDLGPDINIDATALDAKDLEACGDAELAETPKARVCPHCGGSL